MKKIFDDWNRGDHRLGDDRGRAGPGDGRADFLRYVPAVEKLCQVDPLQVCNIDSTDMTPDRWLDIARAVEAGV